MILRGQNLQIYRFTEFTIARTQQNLPFYRFTQFTQARGAAKFTNLPIYQIYHCPESVLSLASCLTQWRLRPLKCPEWRNYTRRQQWGWGKTILGSWKVLQSPIPTSHESMRTTSPWEMSERSFFVVPLAQGFPAAPSLQSVGAEPDRKTHPTPLPPGLPSSWQASQLQNPRSGGAWADSGEQRLPFVGNHETPQRHS